MFAELSHTPQNAISSSTTRLWRTLASLSRASARFHRKCILQSQGGTTRKSTAQQNQNSPSHLRLKRQFGFRGKSRGGQGDWALAKIRLGSGGTAAPRTLSRAP